MGLLDGMLGSVLSSALGGALGGGQAQDPKAALVQGVLGMLLNQAGASNSASGASGAGGMIGNVLGGLLGASQTQGTGNMAGGLGSLLQTMAQNGMGDQAESWQSTGSNLPINTDQLGQILSGLAAAAAGGSNVGNIAGNIAGNMTDILGQLAGHAGVSREDAAGHLSELLPSIVDKLTPNGQVADTSGMDLGSIMQQVLGKPV